MQKDQLITTITAARILGVGEQTVRAWRESGKLPNVGTLPTGTYLFSRAEVEKLAETLKAEVAK